jgi:O-antigen ligase
LGAFFTIFVVVWAIARKELRASFHIVEFPLVLYALATVIAIFAPGHEIVFGPAIIIFKILLFGAAIILFREVPEMRRLALMGHAFFTVWIAAAGLWQYYGGHQQDLEHRITGYSTHVMTFSGQLLPLSLLFGILWLHERKWWMFVPAFLASFALLLTFTRSAWLAWIVAIFVVLVLPRPKWLAYAAAALILFVSFMPIDMFGRLMSSFDPRVESNLDRIRMLEAGKEMIRDYPLFGVGPANVKEVYPIYRRPDAPRFKVPHLHNNIVQIWAERGILALAAYVLFLYFFVRECARAWRGPSRKWAEAGIAVAAGLTCAGMFEFNFGDTEVFYLMLDLFALVIVNLETGASARRREGASAGP